MSEVDSNISMLVEGIYERSKEKINFFQEAPIAAGVNIPPVRVLIDNVSIFLFTGGSQDYLARAGNHSGSLIYVRPPVQRQHCNISELCGADLAVMQMVDRLDNTPYDLMTPDERALYEDYKSFIIYLYTLDGIVQVAAPVRGDRTCSSSCSVLNSRVNNAFPMKYVNSRFSRAVMLDVKGNIELVNEGVNVHRTDVAKSYVSRTHICGVDKYGEYFAECLGSRYEVEYVFLGEEKTSSFNIYLYARSTQKGAACTSAILQISINASSLAAYDFKILPHFSNVEQIHGLAFLKLREYYDSHRMDEIFSDSSTIRAILYDYNKIFVTVDTPNGRFVYIYDVITEGSESGQLRFKANFGVNDDFILSKFIYMDDMVLGFDLVTVPADGISYGYVILDNGLNSLHSGVTALRGDVRFALFVSDVYDGSVGGLSDAVYSDVSQAGAKADFSDSDMRLSVDVEGDDDSGYDSDADDSYYDSLASGDQDEDSNTAAMVY